MNLFTHPITATVFGWAFFNVLLFRIDKDIFDSEKKQFPIKEYIGYTWDNWLSSLFGIPLLIFIGAKGLSLPFTSDGSLQWSELYYLCSGFLTEFCIVSWKKWKEKNK